MKRCDGPHAMSGTRDVIFPLKEGGEERAKQIPSQPRGDRDQTCEDATLARIFSGLRANVGCGNADACMSMED